MHHHRLPGLALITSIAIFTACTDRRQDQPAELSTPEDSTSTENIQPASSGYADVNGLKLYYQVYGAGEPLLMLHGSFLNIPLNWSTFIPLLAKDRKVIVAEMQGHGRTGDIARKISYEGMADDVSGLLQHLKIDSADILGYSMGGEIAFQVAVRHPQQVRRLVILSGVYAHDGWWPEAEAIDLQPYDWSADVKRIRAPMFIALGDADGVRFEHVLELFRAKGGGKMGDLQGLPTSRLAILPGTTHVAMTKRANWLVPMITEFLNSDLNEKPPVF